MTASAGENKLQARSRSLVRPIATRLWDINRVGYDRLPDDGPAILCPNHISFLDSAFLMLTVPRNISFVGKAEYMDSWKTKYLFPAMGMIPIDRSGGSKSQAALEAAGQVPARGELFGVFPEGTRSRDGDLYKGRTGAARLAMQADCPIYPVGITGTDVIQPIDAKMPKLRKACTIEIGHPISPARYRRGVPDHLAWRSMIDEVMFEIRTMTGQRYHDRYSGEPGSVEHTPSKVATVADEPADRDRHLVAV